MVCSLLRGRRNLAMACLLVVGFGFAPYVKAQQGQDHAPGQSINEVATVRTADVGKSGLPLPRFVSLRSGRINVRVGPDRNAHAVAWTYMRQGLPVEIIEEYDHWRRIRDSEGDGGWVDQAFLSGKRTVMPAPWIENSSLAMRQQPGEASAQIAEIEAGVIGDVRRCQQGWCELDIKVGCDRVEMLSAQPSSLLPQFLSNMFSFGDCTHSYHGWLKQTDLWGVYPDEVF